MKIHEHQAKELLREFGIAVPRGQVAFTPEEAAAVAKSLPGPVWVVKAQVHAGGRGKGGGIKLARSAEEVRSLADRMLGMRLVTHQTGPEGQTVRRLLIEDGCEIAREMYLGLVVDRDVGRVAVMASAEGGVEIEEVARQHPEKILREHADPMTGLRPFQARRLGFALGFTGPTLHQFVTLTLALYRLFLERDASLVEVNPLVVTKSGEVLALDAKVNLEDNAEFRYKTRAALRDVEEEDPIERQAKEHDLSYVKLSGSIGCLVNGAGLAMATMDIIKLAGGEPANFLDVGGGAGTAKVTAAFKILLGDADVRAVLVNIFGGIMKCDVLASGVVTACRELAASEGRPLTVPLIVRLEGTNVEQGRQILDESGLPITFVRTMKEGAERAVRAAGGSR